MRRAAWTLIAALAIVVIAAQWLAPYPYDEMFREEPEAAASRAHRMGTDSLGRDRFSRLLKGSQVSLLLAPGAALLSTLLAALTGGFSAIRGGFLNSLFAVISDLFLCLPWMFLLISARALLPLNSGPEISVATTYLLLGVLGWAGPARIVRARLKLLLQRDDRLMVMAAGVSPWRAFRVHLLPNLRPVLAAQFWLTLPVFILSEANLSLIGLGVSEPLPSWGNLLRELENPAAALHSPAILAPLILLIAVIGSIQILLSHNSRNSA